ncbi:MAG: PAS domain-containing protein, partial [Bacteroidales bacterium]
MDNKEKTNHVLLSELEQLKQKFTDLSNSHDETIKRLTKAEFDLHETRKELQCQNLVTEIASNTTLSFDQVIENIVNVLPMAMQFPETSGAYVELNEKTYRTPLFNPEAPKFSEIIFSSGKAIGKLEVSCTTKNSDDTSDIFLASEYVLLSSITKRIELFINKSEASAALVKSEELYRTIINTSPDSITIYDMEGKILMSSPKSQMMFGIMHQDDYIGHSVLEFIDPVDHPKTLMNMEIMMDKSLGSVEYKAIRQDGSTFDIEVNAEVFRDEHGNPIKVLMITRDITERKAITEKLIKSEDKYRNLIETISDVVFDLNLEGTITYLSPSVEKISNYKVDKLIGKSFLDLVHPEDKSKVVDILTKQNLEKHYNLEYRLLLEDQSIRWISVTSQNTYIDNQVCGRTGILQDITERKMAEEKLRKSEEAFRNIVENINDVVYEVSNDGTIQYVSPSIERYLGYKTEELIGKNIFDFIIDQDKKRVYESLIHLDRKDYTYLEYRYNTRNGDVRWVRTSTNPIFENGRIIGGRGVWIDHTDYKISQEKLYQSEARYRSFFEGINSIMILVDPETAEIRDANPAACQYYGWPYSKLCKMHITEINTLSAEELKAEMKTAKLENRRQFFFKHRRADGQIRDVEVYTGPIEYDGNILLYSIVHDITERKQTEEELRKSEEKYRNIFDNIQDTYYEANLDGILTEISPSISIISKGIYNRKGLIGKSILDYYANPEEREAFLTELFKYGRVNDFEITFKNGDGTNILTAVSSTIKLNSNGQAEKIIGSMRDISERKLAEVTLRKSEEKYRGLFFDSPDAFLILCDGIFIECNRVSESLIGGVRSDIIGKTPAEISPEYQPNGKKSSDFSIELIKQTFEKGINSFEWIHKKIDNTTFLAQLHFRTTDFEGKKALFITWQDITLRREAEESLRKLSRAVEQSPVSIMITDINGNIEYANPRACEITGYSLDELIGKNPRLFKSGETSNLEYSKLWDRIRLGKEWKGIFHNKRKNGELLWESSTIAPILDSSGNITHFVAVKEDISERIKMQFDLIESQERFSQIAEQSQTVIWEVDPVGLYTYVSPISSRVWGYSPDELIGKQHFYNLHPAELREEFKLAALALI